MKYIQNCIALFQMKYFTINHIAISVRDVRVSSEFYIKVFGLSEIPNTASSSKTRWFVFNDGRQIHLIPRPNDEIKTTKAVHFALSTPTFDQVVKHLQSLGVSYSDWKNTPNKDYVREDGIRQVYFQDPDGYWIEINDDIKK